MNLFKPYITELMAVDHDRVHDAPCLGVDVQDLCRNGRLERSGRDDSPSGRRRGEDIPEGIEAPESCVMAFRAGS